MPRLISLIIRTFRCNDLPNRWKSAPSVSRDRPVSGILPQFPLTGNVAATVDRMKIDGTHLPHIYGYYL